MKAQVCTGGAPLLLPFGLPSPSRNAVCCSFGPVPFYRLGLFKADTVVLPVSIFQMPLMPHGSSDTVGVAPALGEISAAS